MLAISPDRNGILCFFSLKKQRYSEEQVHFFQKHLIVLLQKNKTETK
jgi:hypothetical protein